MSLAMTQQEIDTIDFKVEQMLDWAKSRQVEAEQLALDSARLISCTGERMDLLVKQGFFQRCWKRLSGGAGAMERVNTGDLIQMQKIAFRYINMLQEQQLLMAHAMLSLKNNLLSLAINEEETRNLVALLAQRTLERFEKLESRVDQLEISTSLQGWLLGLGEREYNERIPTEYMRLFQVINDFYTIKNDAWNYNDLMFMRSAIRTVGLDPKKRLSINAFIDSLTDEILLESVGFDAYQTAISRNRPESVGDYSGFVIREVSSPVFVSIHGLKTQFVDKYEVVEELSGEMNIAPKEALKRLLRRSIGNMNVNLEYEFSLAETAIEILGGMRLAAHLALQSVCPTTSEPPVAINSETIGDKEPDAPDEIHTPEDTVLSDSSFETQRSTPEDKQQNKHLYYDEDLSPVLAQASNSDLEPLVGYICKAMTENLTGSDLYKKHSPNHVEYVEIIEKEIRDFGSNTFGRRISYRTVVQDVAKKIGANFDKNSPIEDIELAIQMHLSSQAWKKMTDEEKKAFSKEMGIEIKGNSIPKALPVAALQLAIRSSGFLAYKLAAIAANSVAKAILGRGLTFAATGTLMRGISVFAGPVGWVLTGLWTLFDLAGPAYRVTIPCVVHIAMLRQQYSLLYCEKCSAPYTAGIKFCPECGEKIESADSE